MQNWSADLDHIKERYSKVEKTIKRRIIVCAGTGCVANGSGKIYEELKKEIEIAGLDVIVKIEFSGCGENRIHLSESGCQGFCQMGPLVTVEPDEILYVKVGAEDVKEIVEQTLLKNSVIERLLYKNPADGNLCKGSKEIPFYNKQKRTVLKECGIIDPADINEYIAHNGYSAARKAYKELAPGEICNTITKSGLRGRGGGGFPTGKKWELTLRETSEKKYIICNGDEGDPGAFMDRSIMEGNPHSVIEGMMIAGKAIGADEGYIYVRMEYPLAVRRIKNAVKAAEEMNLLGKNIFDSGFNFKINVMEGAGAFVCGEETALMASIQGGRGMPNPKPPFPAQKGLWDKPTLINNVETLSAVPLIMREGAEFFSSQGTEGSKGTKTFALTGHVVNTGLIEAPFGTTLREIIYDIGGGIIDNEGNPTEAGFKAVQIGGPSGGCLTEEHLDMRLDYDSLLSIGAMIGSGGLVVMNKETCIIKVAKFFMQFTQNESCGKCVLCREGTKQMLALLEDIENGDATEDTLNLLEDLAFAVKTASLCGLGKTAPSPVQSTLKYFREEYEAHVRDKKCPAKKCKALLTPHVVEELCKGCGLCIKKCPADAITGERKQVHHINEETCIKCGACIESCRLNAIVY